MRKGKEGRGKIGMSGGGGDCSEDYEDTTSLTRPEIRLSIINNLISPNWRELATRQCHSRRRSQWQSQSKGRAGVLAGVEGFL